MLRLDFLPMNLNKQQFSEDLSWMFFGSSVSCDGGFSTFEIFRSICDPLEARILSGTFRPGSPEFENISFAVQCVLKLRNRLLFKSSSRLDPSCRIPRASRKPCRLEDSNSKRLLKLGHATVCLLSNGLAATVKICLRFVPWTSKRFVLASVWQ